MEGGGEKSEFYYVDDGDRGGFFFLMFGTRENKSFRIPEKCPFNRGDRMSNDVWTRRGTKNGKARARTRLHRSRARVRASVYVCSKWTSLAFFSFLLFLTRFLSSPGQPE